MTLGRWMKDYLYIPLGGSRVNTKRRLFFNLWVVFLISGLWHGSAWNFVVWGAYHGLFLVLDRIFLARILTRAGRLISVLFTYLATLVGWVLFRAESFDQVRYYLKAMFSNQSQAVSHDPGAEFWFFMIVGAFFSFFALRKGIEEWQDRLLSEPVRFKTHLWRSVLAILLLLLSIAYITSSGFNPFIYFRF